MTIESSRYALSVEGRRIYVALEVILCEQCMAEILRGDLLTKGLPGHPTARVCHVCRPFEVDEQTIMGSWRHATRHEYYLNI